MTETKTFSSHADAKAAGFFSRRHRTNEAHSHASARNADRWAFKFESASARQAASAKLTPASKLARLNAKLGRGKGATRERAKLAAQIANVNNGRKQ